jgi:hypothetical protein
VRKFANILVVSLISLFSFSSLAATPSEGVPLQVRRGFFTETDVGGFLTLGGDNAYSNLQVYLQLGLGYQLTINDGKGLIPIGLHGGLGTNAGNCFSGLNGAGNCIESDNFTLTFISATGGYLHQVLERFYVGGKAIVGWTLLDPPPVFTGTGADRSPVSGGLNLGAALSAEYATNMDHFSIGIDVSVRYVIGPNILGLAFYPRLQYTF